LNKSTANCPNKRIYEFQKSLIVITLLRLTLTKLQAQNSGSLVDSVHYMCFGYTFE
jgi:hypothetical protein